MKQNTSIFFLLLLLTCFLGACQQEKVQLPILGNRDVVNGDTVYHTIPDFTFVNQDSNLVTNATFKDKIYLVDYFFTSCPTICPKVKQQTLRIYDRFANEDRLKFVSHSFDYRNDDVAALKRYADRLEIDSDRWHLLTGEKDKMFAMSDEYFIVAKEDEEAEGGFDHSGLLVLIDQDRRVRAFANGLDPVAVDQLMIDIEKLLKEL